MKQLAKSLTPSELAKQAYHFYEKFHPEIFPGKRVGFEVKEKTLSLAPLLLRFSLA
jgi:hypothetical protein